MNRKEVDLELRTEDHPAANGRTPELGEVQWEFKFPLEDGTILRLQMGEKGKQDLRQVILDQMIDEQQHRARGEKY